MNAPKDIFRLLKNFLFPPQCIFCDEVMEINEAVCICRKCGKSVKVLSEALCCKKCGKAFVSLGRKDICYFCETVPVKYFDRIVSVFAYEDAVKDSVLRLKVGGVQSYTDTYAQLLFGTFEREYGDIQFDLVCAAPSHINRKLEWGFDPVERMATKLARKVGIPFGKNLLIKTRKTAKQTTLKYKERLTNLKNSMAVIAENKVRGKTILLVDDVCTTRATVIECSRALKSAGAKRVYALTFASTLHKEQA